MFFSKFKRIQKYSSFFQVLFLVVLASNYDRIKMAKELTDYRDAVDLELTSNGRSPSDSGF